LIYFQHKSLLNKMANGFFFTIEVDFIEDHPLWNIYFHPTPFGVIKLRI
jgi:hypothetical protein